MPLTLHTALCCLWRTRAINAAITSRGMQQIGLSYVLAPGLRSLYPDPEDRARAFARYNEHSNTHAFMLPCYAGLLLSMEAQIAAGTLPEAIMTALRQTLATTLSALGDGFFSGAVRTFWALISILLILEDHVLSAGIFTVALLCLLQIFRVSGFFFCLSRGIAALQWLRNLDLISWTERLKIFNALLIAFTLWDMLSDNHGQWPVSVLLCLLAFIPITAWLIGRLHIPRMLIWILALGLIILMDEGLIHV